MKKFLFVFCVWMLSVQSVFAVDIQLKWTNEARAKIGQLRILEGDFSTPSGFDSFTYMQYNQKTSAFDELANTTTESMINNRIQINKEYEYDGQCVSFVKAMTNYPYNTKTWYKGQQLRPGANIPQGVAIAIFSLEKDGRDMYNADGIGAHTGILMGITNSYIWILDQNWKEGDLSGTTGTMGLHKIYFTNSNYQKDDIHNAYAYHVIDKY